MRTPRRVVERSERAMVEAGAPSLLQEARRSPAGEAAQGALAAADEAGAPSLLQEARRRAGEAAQGTYAATVAAAAAGVGAAVRAGAGAPASRATELLLQAGGAPLGRDLAIALVDGGGADAAAELALAAEEAGRAEIVHKLGAELLAANRADVVARLAAAMVVRIPGRPGWTLRRLADLLAPATVAATGDDGGPRAAASAMAALADAGEIALLVQLGSAALRVPDRAAGLAALRGAMAELVCSEHRADVAGALTVAAARDGNEALGMAVDVSEALLQAGAPVATAGALAAAYSQALDKAAFCRDVAAPPALRRVDAGAASEVLAVNLELWRRGEIALLRDVLVAVDGAGRADAGAALAWAGVAAGHAEAMAAVSAALAAGGHEGVAARALDALLRDGAQPGARGAVLALAREAAARAARADPAAAARLTERLLVSSAASLSCQSKQKTS
jgi:hypothetical protein